MFIRLQGDSCLCPTGTDDEPIIMFLANIDQGFAETVTILGTTTPEGKKDNRALSAVDE